MKKKTIEELIKKANAIHRNKYKYDHYVLVNTHTPSCITCPIHGDFLQSFDAHIHQKSGCPECAKIKRNKKNTKFNYDMLSENDVKYSFNYDYLNFEYNGYDAKSTVTCPIHGEFITSWHKLKYGHGCPMCGNKKNYSELRLKSILEKEFNKVEYQKRLSSETDYEKKIIYYRFAIVNDKIPKEFDGMIQHEISHFFQCHNGQTKNEELYNKIKDVINDSKNNVDRNIAYALYLTFNTEIDAFANQYYAYLKQNKIGVEIAITTFPNGEGNPYNTFDKYYDYVVDIEKYLDDKHMKDVFGLSVEQIFSRLENAEKRYKNKMMKVISLYDKEIVSSKMNEHVHRNLSLLFGVRLNFEMDCYQRGIYETESEFF